MKRIIYFVPFALMLIGCNNIERTFDSEIGAINRQTKVLQEQNHILERIAIALERLQNKKDK